MATDLNAAYREIIARQAAGGLPVAAPAPSATTDTGIGFDTEKTPLVTLAIIALALWLLTAK